MADPAHPSQAVYYRRSDGTLSRSSADAIYCDAGQVLEFAAAASSLIPPGFVLGVAERETDLKQNEVDEDLADDGTVKGRTYGLCQMNEEEALKAIKIGAFFGSLLDPAATLCDPATNITIAVAQFERLLRTLCDAAGVDPANPPRDAWAFVAWAHNAGLGKHLDDPDPTKKWRALAAVEMYGGFEWERMKASPPFGLVTYTTERLTPYAEHIMSRVDEYPRQVVTGDGGGGSDVEDPNGLSISSSFTAYDVRKWFAVGVVTLIALLILSQLVQA